MLEKLIKKYRSIFATAYFIVFLAYIICMIDNQGAPDSVSEGVNYYTSGGWAIMCGRWGQYLLMKYCFANLVLPVVNIFIYATLVALAMCILGKLFDLELKELCIVTALALVSPSAISQLQFIYLIVSWASAIILSVSVVYLINLKTEKKVLYVIKLFAAALLVAIDIGMYQTYIGAIAGLALMVMIIDLLRGEHQWKYYVKRVVEYILTCGLGLGFYAFILNIICKNNNIVLSGRVQQFSIKEIFISLPNSIIEIYKIFFSYYRDPMMNRKWFYFVIFVLGFVSFMRGVYLLLSKGKRISAVFSLSLVFILPIALNLVRVVIPYNRITLLMEYQNIFVVPFIICLSKNKIIYLNSNNQTQGKWPFLNVLGGKFQAGMYLCSVSGMDLYVVR